jgi:hypothetical protein
MLSLSMGIRQTFGLFVQKPGTFRSNDELAGLAMTTLALTKELRLVDVNGVGSASSLNLFAHSSSRTPP